MRTEQNNNGITVADIRNGLEELGLQKGDTLLVHSSLGAFGSIKGIAEDDSSGYADAVYNVFAEVLDLPEHGTLVVPTFTHEYARNSVPFVYEESPSEVGLFTEHIRRLPGSLRSVHPINSFTAIGKNRSAVCGDLGLNCYGHNSVFDRLYKLNAKMLFFGCSMRHMTLKHHLEQMAGLPYVYMKAYFTPAYKDGKPLKLPFLAVVRYLNGKVNNNDCSGFRDHLRKKKMLHETKIAGAGLILTSVADAFNEGYVLLQQDPCYFLEKPYYVTE